MEATVHDTYRAGNTQVVTEATVHETYRSGNTPVVTEAVTVEDLTGCIVKESTILENKRKNPCLV